MTISPLSVSVILPVYNGERFLLGALQNIQQQQYQPIEIIVIDDGSTDATAKITAAFIAENPTANIRYIHQAQKGPAAARNRGIEAAKSEVIAFLDVDDLWPKNKLSYQVGYLANHPEVDIAQGLIQQMKAEQSDDPARDQPLYFRPVLEAYFFINLGSCVYRRSLFERVGLLDESLEYSEDTDWFIRAWEKNIKKVSLPEIGLFYRKHDFNMTQSKTLKEKKVIYSGLLKVYQRRISRHRADLTLTSQENAVSWGDYLGSPPDSALRRCNLVSS